MLERDLQKKIIKRLKALGCLATKTDAPNLRGWPDLTVCLPPPVSTIILLEVKTPTGQLSQHQLNFSQHLHTHYGIPVHVVKSAEEAENVIRAITEEFANR